MQLNLIATPVQAIGTLLVAVLLWQLTRIVAGRFLGYWSVGWMALAAALSGLLLARNPDVPPDRRVVGLIVYCLGEYLFGYLVWAGLRNYARGLPVGRSDLWILAPLVGFGAIAPFAFSDIDHLFPLHAPLLALLFILALTETFRSPRAANRPLVGLRIVRLALVALVLLFAHYGPVLYWVVYRDDGVKPAYLTLSSMYDTMAELGLAFGMLVLTTEWVQAELEEKNRQLAAATEQLAHAARTDALTGLFNRRGYDELLATQAGTPFSGSLVAIDLNNLKPINDTHGHLAGDAALQLVARALRVCFRVTDPIFRMGGDEFLVVLPGGSAVDVAARMERIDKALLGQRLPDVAATVDLTIAWGVAEFATGDELAPAVGKADSAMYGRKQSRRGA
jgi:diguanylate cyclase (GGDEF)-like protein